MQDDKFHKIETQLEVIKSEKANIIQESLKKDQLLDSIFSKSEDLKRAVIKNKQIMIIKIVF